MPNIFIHGIFDAPAPPQWLIDKAGKLVTNGVPEITSITWEDDFTARPLLYKNGVIWRNAVNHCTYLDEECLTWSRENVTKQTKDIRLTATTPGLASSSVHIDRIRNYVLIYLLETGGDDHQTVFYQEKGISELIRPKEYHWHVDNYDDLSIVSVIRLEVNKWNLMTTKVLHSVENIAQGRRSIQISLDNFPDDAVITNITNL